MILKPYEVRLIVHLLELASDEFSNHGCNDLSLTDSATDLTDDERREFALNMAIENGDQDEIYETRNGDTPNYATDWCAMSYFARKFAGLDLPNAEPEKEGEKVSRLTAQVVRLKQELSNANERLQNSKNLVILAAQSI